MNRQLRITSPIPPSVNSYLKHRVQRSGKKVYAQVYKSEEAVAYEKIFKPIVQDAMQAQQWYLPEKDQYILVEATFYFPRGRMDTNNHWKLPLDVFSAAGVYLDDDKVMERVKNIYIDKENPRIEFEITISEVVGIFDNNDHAKQFADHNCLNCSKQINKCTIFKEALANKINRDNINLETMTCHRIKVKKNK